MQYLKFMLILTVIKVIKYRMKVNQFLTKKAPEEIVKKGCSLIKIMTDLDVKSIKRKKKTL